MKINYIDFIRRKLNVKSDEFLDKYNKFRLLPFQLMDRDCLEVYLFIQNCKKEYEELGK